MLNRFQKWAVVSTLATYFTIMVGVLVRAAGAGMGCPDWPRCFEGWIPPTNISQVPTKYQAVFNVKLAWIEYINRLIGVSLGIFIFITLVLALRHYRRTPRVLWPTVAAFLGVGFEGWLGKKVVNSVLDPRVVTIHLVVGLGVASLLLYATVCAFFPGGRPLPALPKERHWLGRTSLGVLALTLVQIGLGAFLRGELELVARASPELARGSLIDHVGAVGPLHEGMAQLVFLAVLALALFTRRYFKHSRWLQWAAGFCVLVVVLQLCAGLGLEGLAIPPILQVVHLTLGSLLMGGLTAMVLLAYRLPMEAGEVHLHHAHA